MEKLYYGALNASGRKTKAEEKDFREIAIFKDGIVL